MTPLGVIVTSPHSLKVPSGVRAILPKPAVVRLFQQAFLEQDGESVIVYDVGSRYEPDPFIAIFKNGGIVVRYRLAALFRANEMAKSYALFKSAPIQLPGVGNFFVLTFRNVGDGAGTYLVILSGQNGHYSVVLKQGTTEGRVTILRNGDLQIWSAEDDGSCIWCPQHYEVRTLRWSNGAFTPSGRFHTKHALSPYPVSDNPIVVEK